jgi:hypothetical protein
VDRVGRGLLRSPSVNLLLSRTSCLATLAFALGACLACHPPPPTQPSPPPPPLEEDPDSDVGAADAEAEQDAARAKAEAKVDASARRIIHEVAASRGLPVKGEFGVELISKAGVREFVREVMHEQMTAEEIETTGRIQASFGVVPVGSSGEQVLLDLLEFGVLGIYDPKRKVLLIGDFVDRGALGMVVGHEGAHGLQDMHFDLLALTHMNKGRSDLDTAKTFLIEGDAQAAYLAWMTGKEGIGSIGDDLLDTQADIVLQIQDGMGIPYPTLARMLQMPYTDGTRSVIQLARRDGWSAIDALYAKLPTTSEQMMHLDKLSAREDAIPVKIDTVKLLDLAPDHEVSWEDELGEASLLAMLADVATPTAARAAAAGWGGDRYVALERKNERAEAPLLVGVIAWDSAAEAKQFEPVFRAYLEKHKSGQHLLVRKGDKILYATHHGVVAAEPDALSKAAWKAFAFGG